jgi:hypothetical protein
MKRINFLALSLVVVSSCLFTMVPNATATSGVIDQEYYKTGDAVLDIKANIATVQSFRPNQPTLDKVSVNLRNPAGTVGCGVDKYNGNDWDPVKFINGQTAVSGWNTFDFEDFGVTVGGRYRIWLEASSDSTRWYYGSGNPYDRGQASWGQFYTDYPDNDFHFRTYGYGPEVPAVNPTPDATPAPTITVTTPATQTPDSTTTTSTDPNETPVTAVAEPIDGEDSTASDIKTDQAENPDDIKTFELAQQEKKNSQINLFLIIGSVIVLGLTGLLIYLLIKRKKKEQQKLN